MLYIFFVLKIRNFGETKRYKCFYAEGLRTLTNLEGLSLKFGNVMFLSVK